MGFILIHIFKVQCIMVGNSRQQKHEAMGHMVSTLWKQKTVNASGCSAPFFHSVRIPCVENGSAHSEDGSYHQLT